MSNFEESLSILREFAQADYLKIKRRMLWGQAPAVIYNNDPRTSGGIKPGDFVKILTPNPINGKVRIQVYPYDYRQIGKSKGRVWIDWEDLVRNGVEAARWLFEPAEADLDRDRYWIGQYDNELRIVITQLLGGEEDPDNYGFWGKPLQRLSDDMEKLIPDISMFQSPYREYSFRGKRRILLPLYIRNKLRHPDNPENPDFTKSDVHQAFQMLTTMKKTINSNK